MITDSDSATIRDDLADDIVSTLSNLIDSDAMLSEGYSALQTNGDFETGDLTGWSALGVAGLTTASDTEAHAGDYSCKIECLRVDHEPNLVTNSGFEDGLTGWSTYTGDGNVTTRAASEASAYTGTYGYEHDCDSNSNGAIGIYKNIASLLEPSTTYTVSVWIYRTRSDHATYGPAMQVWDHTNSVGILAKQYPTANDEWQLLSGTFTTEADASTDVRVWLIGNGAAYFDDIKLVKHASTGRTQDVTLTSSATFTATCYALMSEIDTTYRMRLSWTDTDGAHTEDAAFAVSDDWAVYTLTAAVGAGLTGTSTLSFYGTGAGYVDDVTLIRTRTTAELADIVLPGNGVFRRGGMTESDRLVLPQHKLPAWVVHVGQSASSREGTWGADEQDFEVVIEWLLTTVDVDTAAQEANQALSKLVRMWRKIDQRTVGYGALRTLMVSGDGEVIDGPTVEAPVWGANNENDGETIDFAMVGGVACTVRLRVARS